ncbi:MAG TPA: TlpA disulfide reductase family protein [Terriglobales bacterium]|nr:TlpA disulfide reductase family protein [Terriglobales bacterium]
MKRNAIVLAVVIAAVALMLFTGVRMTKPKAGTLKLPAVGKNGSVAPDFELKSLEGKPVRLSDFRGKAVLLNFWATWCAPCKVEMPWFVDLQKQYGTQGLQVIGVAMDDSGEEAIAKFAGEMGVNYPVLIGKEAVGDAYGGVEFLPTTFFIDRQGRVVDRVFGLVGHSDIEDNIKKALGVGSPTQANAAPASAKESAR